MTELLSGFTGYVLPFLIILTVLVFVHELGHYLVARYCGVRVEVFSIGFGPELFGRNDRHGTRWKLSAIPLGGYVKMYGEADAAGTPGRNLQPMSQDERDVSFHYKTLRQRTAIVSAGPIANFAFAIVLLAALFATVGQRVIPPTIDTIVAGSAAERAGLVAGDLIVSVDGQDVERFADLQVIVRDSPERPLAMVVRRDGGELALTVTPDRVEGTDPFGKAVEIGRLGVQSQQVSWQRRDPVSALWLATAETWSISWQTLQAVGQIITGSRGSDELGGPIRIAQMSGEVAQSGIVATFWFAAVLSINLGLINLFPIPVLDGGHLVMYLAEAVRGRPLGEKVQEYASLAGLTLVIALMVFVTWNDLTQLKVIQMIGALFS